MPQEIQICQGTHLDHSTFFYRIILDYTQNKECHYSELTINLRVNEE